jgi:hypothetical protein
MQSLERKMNSFLPSGFEDWTHALSEPGVTENETRRINTFLFSYLLPICSYEKVMGHRVFPNPAVLVMKN